MKKQFTFLFFSLLCICANGQRKDTSLVRGGGSVWGVHYGGAKLQVGTISSSQNLSYDTAKCVMLYIDTVGYYAETYSDGQQSAKIKFAPDWMYGYSVTPHIQGSFRISQQAYYLDKFKSPLKKSIIVWLSKPL